MEDTSRAERFGGGITISKRSTSGSSIAGDVSAAAGADARCTTWGRLVDKRDKASATSVWNEIIGVALETDETRTTRCTNRCSEKLRNPSSLLHGVKSATFGVQSR